MQNFHIKSGMLLSVSSTNKQWSLSPLTPKQNKPDCDRSSETDLRFLHFGAGLPFVFGLHALELFLAKRLNFTVRGLMPRAVIMTIKEAIYINIVAKFKKTVYILTAKDVQPICFRRSTTVQGHLNASLVASWQMMHFFQSSDIEAKASRRIKMQFKVNYTVKKPYYFH